MTNEILDRFISTRNYLAVLFFKEGEEASNLALQVKCRLFFPLWPILSFVSELHKAIVQRIMYFYLFYLAKHSQQNMFRWIRWYLTFWQTERKFKCKGFQDNLKYSGFWRDWWWFRWSNHLDVEMMILNIWLLFRFCKRSMMILMILMI